MKPLAQNGYIANVNSDIIGRDEGAFTLIYFPDSL